MIRNRIHNLMARVTRRLGNWLERGPLAALVCRLHNLEFYAIPQRTQQAIEDTLAAANRARSDAIGMTVELCDEIRKRTRQVVEVIVEYEVRGAVNRLGEEVKSLIYSRDRGEASATIARLDAYATDVTRLSGAVECMGNMIADLCKSAGVRPKLDTDGSYIGMEPTATRTWTDFVQDTEAFFVERTEHELAGLRREVDNLRARLDGLTKKRSRPRKRDSRHDG